MQAKLLTPTKIARKLERLGKLNAKNARRIRSLKLKLARMLHAARPAEAAFDRVFFQKYHQHYALPQKYKTLLQKAKNLEYLLEILDACEAEGCPPQDFIRAQFEMLTYTGHKPFLNVCRGPNASKRYQEWKDKHEQRFRKKHDQLHDLHSSLHKAIRTSIFSSHRQAISWVPSIADLEPPSLAAALCLGYPQLSVWYLIAVSDTRVVMAQALELSEHAEKQLALWNSSRSIREVCERALQDAILKYGKVEL